MEAQRLSDEPHRLCADWATRWRARGSVGAFVGHEHNRFLEPTSIGAMAAASTTTSAAAPRWPHGNGNATLLPNGRGINVWQSKCATRRREQVGAKVIGSLPRATAPLSLHWNDRAAVSIAITHKIKGLSVVDDKLEQSVGIYARRRTPVLRALKFSSAICGS
jgi:hypothetical protein